MFHSLRGTGSVLDSGTVAMDATAQTSHAPNA